MKANLGLVCLFLSIGTVGCGGGGSPEESYLLEGTFSVGSEIRTSSGVDAHEITFNFTDPDGAITISGAVLVENTVLYFGMEDTASGLPRINYNAVYTKQ